MFHPIGVGATDTNMCVVSPRWTQANTTDLDEHPEHETQLRSPKPVHFAANNSTFATPRCQDALFFFFVMKRRCHESLTRQERCVRHATLLGPTFSKSVSLPRVPKRIACMFTVWTTNWWWWRWFAKSRVEEKLQHRLVIVP